MRPIKALFALATLTLTSLCLPHAVSAQTTTQCGFVTQTGTWPATAEEDCSNTDGTPPTADATSQSSSISNKTHGIAYDQLNQLQVVSYIFESPADFKAYPAFASQPAPQASAFGTVVLDSNNMPTALIAFEKNGNNIATPSAYYSSGQAIGHSLDYTLGYVMNGGVITFPVAPVSGSSIYSSELSYDWSVLNAKAPCLSGGGGVFNNQKDHNGVYICTTNGTGATLSAGYSGNVQSVLNGAWPGIYDSNANIFAETYNWEYVGSDNARDQYLNQFKCSSGLELVAANQGKLPTATVNALPTGCPVPPITTSCTQVFSGSASNGYPSYGYIFDCASSSNAVAEESAEFLVKLGGTTTINGFKSALKADNSYIYFFTNQNGYAAAFTTAGVDTTNTTLTGANAFTAPIGKIWYTVVNETAATNMSNNVPSSSQATYIVAHELGHTEDFNTGQHSGDTLATGFDLAMQQDWLYLDYTSWTSATVNTLRLPCATSPYTGPLVNAKDPLTGNAFCNAGALAPNEGIWAGRSNSYILKSVTYASRATGQYELDRETTVTPIGNNPGLTPKTGWREWFAQGLAIQANAPGTNSIGVISNLPALDNAVSLGYFGCTAAYKLNSDSTSSWLHWVYVTGTRKLPSVCTSALPPGWAEYN